MSDFVEIRCRQSGTLLGVIDWGCVPDEFLRGSHKTWLMVTPPQPVSPTLSINALETMPIHRLLVERMTFQWRDPDKPRPGGIVTDLLLTFMMVEEEDIEQLKWVRGFRRVNNWIDDHGRPGERVGPLQ